MTNASRYFVATPAENGGVRLRLRAKFRDIQGSYLGDDGVARPGLVEHMERDPDDFLPRGTRGDLIKDQNGNGDMVEQTVFVGSPPAPGASYRLETLGNGCIAMVLVSPPDQLIGNTISNNSGIVQARNMDRAARSISTGRSGGEPRKLATLNSINRAHFKR